jgi:hypothetical protein
MRTPPLFANHLAAFLAFAAVGGPLAPSASADTIYVPQALVPQPPTPPGQPPKFQISLQPAVPGWAAVGSLVKRKVRQPDGSDKDVPFFGIRGRIVDRTPAKKGHIVHFQLLLQKTSTLPRPGSNPRKAKIEYAYHPTPLQIPSGEIREIEDDFDSLYDLRGFLGNDDVRLREYSIQDPRILDGTFKTLTRAEVVKRISRGDDTVYAFLGYGGVHGPALMTYRLGLRGVTWKAMKDAPGTTPYLPGWMTFLVRFGAPKNAAERDKAIQRGLARGEIIPAPARIPLLATFFDPSMRTAPPPAPAIGGGFSGVPEAVPIPVRPAPPAEKRRVPGELFLGAEIRPILYRLLVGAARDAAYPGLVLSGEVDPATSKRRKKKPKPHYKDSVVKIMRELCAWSRVEDGPRDTARQKAMNARARAVGRVARAVVIESLEAAGAGMRSPVDVLNRLPVGTTTADPGRLQPGAYLPVDPSRVALVAMEVIQGPRHLVAGGRDRVEAPEWQQPDSSREARRLVKTLIRLSRPRYAKDPLWKNDPRSGDYGRAFMRRGETRLYQEAMVTLGGAARGGLLVATPSGGRFKPSPYLRPMVGLLNELEHRDRVVLMHAMTLAGVGDQDLYEAVIDRLFSLCLDQKGWSNSASPMWIQRSRRDAVASLGLLVKLEESVAKAMRAEAGGNVPKSGPTVRLGAGSVSQLIFSRLDRLLDAQNKKRASVNERGLIKMIKEMATGKAASDVTAAWLPQVARSQDLARDLTNSYHRHVENAPASLQIEGSRRVEGMKANLDEPAAIEKETERIRTEVEDAKERYGQFPFPARPKGT